MAIIKKASNQPKPKTFTKKQLEEWYGWSEADVESYVTTGQLRQAFDTSTRPDLQNTKYYKCKADNEELLNAIKDIEPLSAFTKSIKQENFISCPPYLYLPVAPNSFEFHNKWMPSILSLYGEMPEYLTEEQANQNIMLRYFYDFEGNALVPVTKDCITITFEMVKFQFRKFLIFPFEEVERFRTENAPKRKIQGEKPETTKRKDDIMEIIKDLGYNPKSFPEFGKPRSPELLEIFRNNSNFENKKSKRTAKTEVWEEYALRISKKEKDDRSLSEYFDFVMGRDYKRFDKAWQALRKEGKIIYKKKPKKA